MYKVKYWKYFMLPGLMKYEIGGLASKAYFSEPIASFQQ